MKIKQIKSSTTKFWDRYPLRGAYYHRASDNHWTRLREYAQQGEPLLLRRQPSNAYDPGAIEVLFNDSGVPSSRVGWVPKESNRQLGILMDHTDVQVLASIDPKSDFANHKIFMDVYVNFGQTHEVDDRHERLRREIAEMLTLPPLEL